MFDQRTDSFIPVFLFFTTWKKIKDRNAELTAELITLRNRSTHSLFLSFYQRHEGV